MSTPSSSAKAYEAGRRNMVSGDFATAHAIFVWAVNLDPGNPIYTHAAGKAAFHAGLHEEAAEFFRRAIGDTVNALGRTHPYLATVAGSLAELYERQGRLDDARKLRKHVKAIQARNASAPAVPLGCHS